MKKLIENFKFYGGLALAAGVGFLYWLLGQRTKQRDAERKRANTAERNHKTEKKRREDTKRISQAQAEARDFNEQQRQQRHDTPTEDRRSGRLDGFDRVRDYDNRD